ncbi:MAG: DUF1823 family protein, partial [Cyanobium sp. MAG_04]|nr:DUF1823 family protein [Cyanobium sp. MAG_04]
QVCGKQESDKKDYFSVAFDVEASLVTPFLPSGNISDVKPPARTRRATGVNWLLAHLAERGEPLPQSGPLPQLLTAPDDPVLGHPGDLPIS